MAPLPNPALVPRFSEHEIPTKDGVDVILILFFVTMPLLLFAAAVSCYILREQQKARETAWHWALLPFLFIAYIIGLTVVLPLAIAAFIFYMCFGCVALVVQTLSCGTIPCVDALFDYGSDNDANTQARVRARALATPSIASPRASATYRAESPRAAPSELVPPPPAYTPERLPSYTVTSPASKLPTVEGGRV